MIVVDSNVIAYLFIQGKHTDQARKAFLKDADWVAPILWRSELRNVLMLYLRQGHIALDQALELMSSAEQLMHGAEYHVQSKRVLELVAVSNRSAYDCEFVALAEELGVPLVTSDVQLGRAFGNIVVGLDAFTR